MSKRFSPMEKYQIITGTKDDAAGLIKKLQTDPDPHFIYGGVIDDDQPKRVRVFSSDWEGERLMSMAEYRNIIRQPYHFDFLYDELEQHFWWKTRSGPHHQLLHEKRAIGYSKGQLLLRVLAQSNVPETLSDIVDTLEKWGTHEFDIKDPEGSIRSAKSELCKLREDLIQHIPKQGYQLNPTIQWIVIQEKIL